MTRKQLMALINKRHAAGEALNGLILSCSVCHKLIPIDDSDGEFGVGLGSDGEIVYLCLGCAETEKAKMDKHRGVGEQFGQLT